MFSASHASLEYEHRKELFNQESARPIFFWSQYQFYAQTGPINRELENTGFPEHNALLLRSDGKRCVRGGDT